MQSAPHKNAALICSLLSTTTNSSEKSPPVPQLTKQLGKTENSDSPSSEESKQEHDVGQQDACRPLLLSYSDSLKAVADYC